VGSENGHLIRRTQAVRREAVVDGGSEVLLRKLAAGFLERLFPTATHKRRSHAGADHARRGSPVEWRITIVWTIENGKLVRGKAFSSRAEALAAAGLHE
jgi:ketosteroid isomerase-like protein